MWVLDLLVILLLGICAFTDFRERKISLSIIAIFFPLGLIVNYVFAVNTLKSIIGGIAVGLVFTAISLITKEKIGFGDGLIISICGLYLGFWNNLILVFDTFLLCGLAGIILLAVKKIKLEYELPLIPFMLAAYIGGLFL